MEWLVEPLQYQFFLHGLLVAVLVGGLCGLLGVFIVLRKMSYIGHGLSHAVFGGAVASYLLNLNFYLGAGVWGLLSVLLIDKLAAKRDINPDAAIGIVTTASFAVGVALMSRSRRFMQDFEAALFGNVLGVSQQELVTICIIASIAGLTILLLYKPLLFSTFDEEVAQVSGVPTRKVRLLFSCILAIAVLASVQVLGVTLIAAAIVIPATTSRLLTNNFAMMMLLATALGGMTAFLGMYLSYYLNIASGASIVLFATALFMAVLYFRHLRTVGRRPKTAHYLGGSRRAPTRRT
jgi:manganese/iron transport system permease protein/iron/zinc/copper transport system permease protein